LIYCAPEMLEAEEDGVAAASRATDMYAFALIAYEVLTSQRPYQHVTKEAQLVKAVVTKKERPPLGGIHGVDFDVLKMIDACWDPDRLKRMPAYRCMEVLGKLLMRLDREVAHGDGALSPRRVGRDSVGRAVLGQSTIMMKLFDKVSELTQKVDKGFDDAQVRTLVTCGSSVDY